MRFQVCALLLTCRDVAVKSADEFRDGNFGLVD